jgi:integrase/recombinase XerC
MIRRYGLDQDLKPYSCRHTTGTTLALADTPLLTIKDVMRHSKITTTQRYVHLDASPLIRAANEAYGTS